MENEKKLRYAAAMFALNPSAAFSGMEKARTKVANVEYNVSPIRTLWHIFVTDEGNVLCNCITLYYVTVSLYVQTSTMLPHINKSDNFPYCTKC